MRSVAALVISTLLLTGGCRTNHSPARPTTQQLVSDGLTPMTFVDSVQADCVPPAGWTAEPLKQSPRHTHQIWISPTKHTAYGVIHFSLPLPAGDALQPV